MILWLIDVGNSRCKWACADGGQWIRQGGVENTACLNLLADFAALPTPQRILVANVAGAEMSALIVQLCAKVAAVPVEFMTASATQCGVINHYEQASQLGADRWAALIAARSMVDGACVVVSCGTATTIDALSAQGDFLGGLILPGIEMMQKSLLAGTAQLRDAAGALKDFPCNTADAIWSATVRATVALILQQQILLGGDATCVLSGGAAEIIYPQLPENSLWLENLVLHGLQIIGETASC